MGQEINEDDRMNHIEPSRLKELRKSMRLTQKELGKRSAINEQTISNLERGKVQRRIRQRIVDSLCKVLCVDASVLAGTAPIPERENQDKLDLLLGQKSQINHRITDTSRNALLLVAMRYGIQTTRIYEIAPFLFLWAAEQSLRRREERLARLESTWDDVGSMQDQVPHLSQLAISSSTAENIMLEEKKSIEDRDLFGLLLKDTFGAEDEYDESSENPFTVFLSDLAKQLGDLAEFDGWDAIGSPDYEVCPDEAARLVGGDEKLVREILVGNVPLHEMPEKLKKKEAIKERVDWVQLQAQEKRKRFDESFPGLSDSIKNLINKPGASS